MKKILSILSSLIFTATSISNLSNVPHNLNSNVQKNIANTIANTSQVNDSAKLEAWHNSLSIEQDAQAKQAYLDSMVIKTTKATNANIFDTYTINFDNQKLQSMLKNKLLNQDAYNIFSNQNQSKILTNEANATVILPTKNNINVPVHAFQSNFYIKNNQMHFVDKDHQNPYKINLTKLNIKFKRNANFLISITSKDFIAEINWWEETNCITITERNAIFSQISEWLMDGYSWTDIPQLLQDVIYELIADEEAADFCLELLICFIVTGFNYSDINIISVFIKNFDKINSINDKYHQGASETFYFWGLYMDPNSIKPVPPMNKSSEINDKLKANSTKRDEIITIEYDNDPLLDYNGYDSLWQYLNADGQTFNLNKIFQSYVGILGQYNNWNYTFHHLEATSILKSYLNTWITLTKASWTNNNSETSLAQMQMMISDNFVTKTVEFNFKSILCNINAYDSVGNKMYH